jgi:hypothetical protein
VRIPLLAVVLALVAAGCSSGGGGGGLTAHIQPARVFALTGVQPNGPAPVGRPTTVAFTIRQPSGQPLTKFRTGPGPHTGVHVIIVRDDLSSIVHEHPPVGPNGRISLPVTFARPGHYRMLVDVYPALGAPLRNFQLHADLRAGRGGVQQPLPPPRQVVTVNGYRVAMTSKPRLAAIQPAFVPFKITDPNGRPARFEPWFGALAHAIFFHAGNLDYFHTHVCSPGATGCASLLGSSSVTGRSTKPGVLTVGVLLPEPGTWRLFLQTQVGGHVITAPFTLKVH